MCWNVFTNLEGEETSSISTYQEVDVFSVLYCILQHTFGKRFHTQRLYLHNEHTASSREHTPSSYQLQLPATITAGNHKLVTSWITESCVINTVSTQCIWRVTMTGGACLIYFLRSKINRPTSFLNMHFWNLCEKILYCLDRVFELLSTE